MAAIRILRRRVRKDHILAALTVFLLAVSIITIGRQLQKNRSAAVPASNQAKAGSTDSLGRNLLPDSSRLLVIRGSSKSQKATEN